jgi:hypothetical protein
MTGRIPELKSRISVDGVRAVQRDLSGVGEAGRRAGNQVKSGIEGGNRELGRVVAAAARAQASFTALRAQVATLGPSFAGIGNGLSGLQQGVQRVATRVGLISTALLGVGAAAAAAGRSITTGVADRLDQLGERAADFGLQAEDLSRLDFAGTFAGVNERQLTRLLTTATSLADSFRTGDKAAQGLVQTLDTRLRAQGRSLLQPIFGNAQELAQSLSRSRVGVRDDGTVDSQALLDAVQRARAQAAAFGQAGQFVTGLRAPETRQILGALIDVFSGIQDGAERAQLGVELFGRQAGPRLATFLARGRTELEALVAQSDRLGATVDQDLADLGGSFNDALDRIRKLSEAVGNAAARLILPDLLSALERIEQFIVNNREEIVQGIADAWTSLTTSISDLISLFRSGGEAETSTQWTRDFYDGVKLVEGVFINLRDNVWPVITSTLGEIDTLTRRFFGIGLGELAIYAALLQLLGVTQLLGPALTVVGAALRSVLTVVGLLSAPLLALVSGPAAPFVLLATVAATVAANWERVTAAINAAAAALREFFGLSAQPTPEPALPGVPRPNVNARGVGSVIAGFASGGIVRGPGGPRSDSILARLSNGEGVINARAVGFYGPRLIEALNSLAFPRFADGGIVGSAAMATAGASGTPVNLSLNGRSYQTTAASNVASALVNDVRRSNRVSTGRARGWER